MSRGLRERMTAPVKSHADTKVAQPLRVENDGHQHAVPGDFPKQSDQEKMDPATEDETELVFEDDTLHHVTEDQTPTGEPRADADVDVERGDNTVERESAKEPEPCPLGWSTPSEIAGSLAFIVGLLLMLALVVALSAGFCYVFWMWGAKVSCNTSRAHLLHHRSLTRCGRYWDTYLAFLWASSSGVPPFPSSHSGGCSGGGSAWQSKFPPISLRLLSGIGTCCSARPFEREEVYKQLQQDHDMAASLRRPSLSCM